MPYSFPSQEWILALKDALNNSPSYNKIAHAWEGDLLFVIERAGGPPVRMYLDLWHGQCREAVMLADGDPDRPAAFRMLAPLDNFIKVLRGQLDPMQAMMTGKLKVQGNMIAMMKNVPTVLEFVRTAQGLETVFEGQ